MCDAKENKYCQRKMQQIEEYATKENQHTNLAI